MSEDKSGKMKFIAILLVMISLAGCATVDLYVLDTAGGKLKKSEVVSRSLTIPRPMGVSGDNASFYVLGRDSAQSLLVEQFGVDGVRVSDHTIPLLTQQYAASDTALSPDGNSLIYSDVILHPNGDTDYKLNVYRGSKVIWSRVIPNWSSGTVAWLSNDQLLLIPSGLRKLAVPSLLNLNAGILSQLSGFGLGGELMRAYPSLSRTKIAFWKGYIGRPGKIVIYDLQQGRVIWELACEHQSGIGLEMVWDSDESLYFSDRNNVYKCKLDTEHPQLVFSVENTFYFRLLGVSHDGRIHFTLMDVKSLDWAGNGWCVYDPRTRQWGNIYDIHYIRDVQRSRDARYFVFNVGL